ncbi:solute carrier family 23 protein [Mycetohabitans endofungorum]|uniref:solute carrier family 23 protein n=1 Tax=Mycetohabitans endofungorum TaxID=417203 RepID=UPI002B05A42F|nr:solute carrier family 23 protein [Mycetohabitans endofungorum]
MSSTDVTAVRPSQGWLERRFALTARGSSPRVEIIAGLTAFLAAAYLLVVIPSLLATGGIDRGAATTATPYLFAFFAAEFFSTLGTVLAVGAKANLLDEHGNLPDIHRPFLVDSIAATLGPLLSIPALTALVESAAGAEAGARTGLSSLAAAAMFAMMLLFVPVALAIPKEATAPALTLIGLSMFSTIRHTHFDDFTDALPVMSMVLLTLASNSFGTGIAGGLLCYVLIKLLAGRWHEAPWGLVLLAVPLGYYFWTVVKLH